MKYMVIPYVILGQLMEIRVYIGIGIIKLEWSRVHTLGVVYTIAYVAAISLECPNGSICQATRGLASAPKFSSTNFNPKRVQIIRDDTQCHACNQCIQWNPLIRTPLKLGTPPLI